MTKILLQSTDYMDRVYPSESSPKDRLTYLERRKRCARAIRDIFSSPHLTDKVFSLLIWQAYITEGLTQREIADLYGVSQPYISRLLKEIKAIGKGQCIKLE